MADKGESTIIIKKIKKGGHGHHGGAWKIAYADFVTAMMAFFLLMWLLSQASEDQLVGIADYFTPSEGVIGESGALSGKGQFDDTFESEDNKSDKPGGQELTFGSPRDGDNDGLDEEKLNMLGKELQKSVEEAEDIQDFKENIAVEMTSDGLLIQISSSKDDPPLKLFEHGKSEPSEDLKKILKHIVKLIYYVPNYVSIAGHTDSAPIKNKGANYGNWELSSDRAGAVRRFMINSGLDKDQIARIIGKAAVEPSIPENPRDIKNRRVGITLLKPNVFMPDSKSNSPGGFFNKLDK